MVRPRDLSEARIATPPGTPDDAHPAFTPRDAVPPPDDLTPWLPRLRRYARALAHNREDADDLVQDTLERAWSRSALWRQVGDMRAWLFGIMHNLHVDRLRRSRVATVPLDDGVDEPPVAGAQEHGLAVRDLAAALDALAPEQRAVLVLVTIEGMSYADVAATLGIPTGTVMSRLSRARERLRVQLARAAEPVDPRRPAGGNHLRIVR